MKLNSKEYQIYQNIDFTKRYETLSDNFQTDDELKYDNNEVLALISRLGYKAKYKKSGNFFRVEDKIEGIEFYFHASLKYSIAELIIGASDIASDTFITGSVFGGLYDDIKYAEGIDLKENIRNPSFRSYAELEAILKEALSIYDDFKKEVLKQEFV